VRTIHKEGAARLARTDIIAGGRLGLSGVLADCSTELPGHGLVKIAGDNTGLPGSRALSAGGSTGLYGWDAGGSTGLPVSRLLKKADAGGNFGFPGRTDDNSGRQGHRLGGSARLPKDVDVNYSQYTQVSRGSLGVNGVRGYPGVPTNPARRRILPIFPLATLPIAIASTLWISSSHLQI
jgi:hypothetical protein